MTVSYSSYIFCRQVALVLLFIHAFNLSTVDQLSASSLVMPWLCVLEVRTDANVVYISCLSMNILESEYRDRLELKAANDRTLGVGVSPTTNLLLILTATTMMKVVVDLEKIQAFKPE